MKKFFNPDESSYKEELEQKFAPFDEIVITIIGSDGQKLVEHRKNYFKSETKKNLQKHQTDGATVLRQLADYANKNTHVNLVEVQELMETWLTRLEQFYALEPQHYNSMLSIYKSELYINALKNYSDRLPDYIISCMEFLFERKIAVKRDWMLDV